MVASFKRIFGDSLKISANTSRYPRIADFFGAFIRNRREINPLAFQHAVGDAVKASRNAASLIPLIEDITNRLCFDAANDLADRPIGEGILICQALARGWDAKVFIDSSDDIRAVCNAVSSGSVLDQELEERFSPPIDEIAVIQPLSALATVGADCTCVPNMHSLFSRGPGLGNIPRLPVETLLKDPQANRAAQETSHIAYQLTACDVIHLDLLIPIPNRQICLIPNAAWHGMALHFAQHLLRLARQRGLHRLSASGSCLTIYQSRICAARVIRLSLGFLKPDLELTRPVLEAMVDGLVPPLESVKALVELGRKSLFYGIASSPIKSLREYIISHTNTLPFACEPALEELLLENIEHDASTGSLNEPSDLLKVFKNGAVGWWQKPTLIVYADQDGLRALQPFLTRLQKNGNPPVLPARDPMGYISSRRGDIGQPQFLRLTDCRKMSCMGFSIVDLSAAWDVTARALNYEFFKPMLRKRFGAYDGNIAWWAATDCLLVTAVDPQSAHAFAAAWKETLLAAVCGLNVDAVKAAIVSAVVSVDEPLEQVRLRDHALQEWISGWRVAERALWRERLLEVTAEHVKHCVQKLIETQDTPDKICYVDEA